MPLSRSRLSLGTKIREIRGNCQICGDTAILEKFEWTDRKGITAIHELLVCEDCRNELFVFDQVYHASDFGAKFSNISGNGFNLDNEKISKIVKSSEWGHIEDRNNHKRIFANEWSDLDEALE